MADFREHICSDLTGRVVKTSLSPIGRGGFAHVFLADFEDTAVALKIPRPAIDTGSAKLNQVRRLPRY